MARRFTIEILMDLAKAIGANPNKFMGTKTNISFLGKGPTKNPLFQNRLAGLENASVQNLGKPETLVNAVEDAMSFASAGKLNTIQTEILGHNLSGINKILNPPPLPMASVTPIRGLGSLESDAKFSKFFGYPKHSSGKRMSTRELIKWRETNPTEYDAWRAAMKRRADESANRLIMEGKIPDARGRTWNFKTPSAGDRRYNELTGLNKPRLVESRLPEPGPGDLEAMNRALNAKTGMSRAIARQILQQDTRLKLNPQELYSLRTGARGEDPLDLMKKYYGESMLKYDDFLNSVNVEAGSPTEFAEMILKNVKLIPQFAEGGLAEILQAPRSGYAKGRLVKGALAILNRNKKNADYMFKASDNVSPGYAAGDIKYNAELLADQLADDAGVVFADLDSISQTKFYGTAYDYLAKEMGQYRQMTKMLKDVEQKMQLSDFSVKGRKPSASGGLARILEI